MENQSKEESKSDSSKKKNELTENLSAIFLGLAILCAGVAYLFHTRWQDAEGRAVMLEGQNLVKEQHGSNVNYNLKKELEDASGELKAITDTNTVQIKLKGLAISTDSKAVVYWNKPNVFLRIHNLPNLPVGKQYQLWAIKNGAALDLGVFELDNDVHKMNDIDDAQSFMITLEKTGGSEKPDMNAIYLMGNI